MRHRITAGLITAGLMLGTMAIAMPAASANDEHPCHPHADPNVILGTLGNDRLPGTDCDDAIYGFAGMDRLIGRAGEDTLRGGRDNDVLRGIDGERDVLAGGSGIDRCRGDSIDIFLRCEIITVVDLDT